MTDIKRLRSVVQKFEDRKITVAQLGREVLHVANGLQDGRQSALRMALVRLGYRFTSLAERSLRDDVQDEVRGWVDDLVEQIIDADSETD